MAHSLPSAQVMSGFPGGLGGWLKETKLPGFAEGINKVIFCFNTFGLIEILAKIGL